MIKEIVDQSYRKIIESTFANKENILTQKVKKLSESYIFSIGSQTLFASLALKACGISFGTSFPILFALVVAKSFITALNHAKTAIKATLNGAKAVIQITAEKAASPFRQVAKVVNDIFTRIYASLTSFAKSSYHLIRGITYSSNFKGFNHFSPTPPTIEDEYTENQELTIEEEVNIAENLIPSKRRIPLCDSKFIIREKDTKEAILLRGVPSNLLLENTQEIQDFKKTLRKATYLQDSLTLLFLKEEDSAPWMFLLEHGSDRPLKDLTSKRLGTAVTALKNIPESLLLEGIPVDLRPKL